MDIFIFVITVIAISALLGLTIGWARHDSLARMAVRYEKRDDLGPIEMREHLVSRT